MIHKRAAIEVKTCIVRSSFVIGPFLTMAVSRDPVSYPLFWAISISIWATSAIPSLSNHGHSMRVKVYHRSAILIITKVLYEIKYDGDLRVDGKSTLPREIVQKNGIHDYPCDADIGTGSPNPSLRASAMQSRILSDN